MNNSLYRISHKGIERFTDLLRFAVSLKVVCVFFAVALSSTLKAQDSDAEVVDAAFASALTVDGNAADWANLSSGVVTMDTSIRGANGTLAVDIRYAWDDTNMYILVQENSNGALSTNAQEAANGDAYLKEFWLFDCIAFWIDLDNTSGTEVNGNIVAAGNADFQPWFGFSSSGRTDLIYGRANNTGDLNLDGLENGKVATGGTFAAHNRTIEVAIAWADIAATVDSDRQPGGDLESVIAPGFVFGSDPLLLNNDYEGQAFIGPKQYEAPSGTDSDSRDIRLVAQDSDAEVVDAAFASALTVDGNAADWANLSSGVVTMDTSIRGANGTLAVDIRYAWDDTNMYILVQENSNGALSTNAQEAANGDAYLKEFWLFDCIAFWIDLDNTSGTEVNGNIVAAGNADFQPWFGFSSSGRTDLIYGRANNTGDLNLDGLENGKVATGGTFAAHNRTIEVAIAWADIAATVDSDRQPGGDLESVIAPGFVFGSDPLLLNNDYEGQAFIGPKQYEAPSGTDSDSRDIRLVTVSALPAGLIITDSSLKSNGSFEFIWNSRPSDRYQVERRKSMHSAWQVIAEGYPDGGATAYQVSYTDKQLGEIAFYRVAEYQPPRIFEENFESGVNGWKTVDINESGTVWELGKPTNGPTEAHSGANVFGTGLSADYAHETIISLFSPVIDLTGIDKAKLEFWSYLDVEGPVSDELTEYAEVYILDDNSEYLTDMPLWKRSGSYERWRKESVSIPDEALGKKIQLEFHFGSDFVSDGGPYAGWFIDDVSLSN